MSAILFVFLSAIVGVFGGVQTYYINESDPVAEFSTEYGAKYDLIMHEHSPWDFLETTSLTESTSNAEGERYVDSNGRTHQVFNIACPVPERCPVGSETVVTFDRTDVEFSGNVVTPVHRILTVKVTITN